MARLLEELRALNAHLGVPTPRSYGIAPGTWAASIPLMVEQAIASGSPANNPRLAEPGEIAALYEQAFG